MSNDTIYQKLRTHLSYLGLGRAAEVLASHLEEAQRERTSATAFLERLLAEEVAATEVRRLAGRLRFAHFPVDKRLEDFDFDAQPGLDRKMIEELATLRFVEEKANLLLIGRPGVGKTHIALALGHRAVEAGYRVYYTTAADLAARCRRAALEGRWATTMRFFNGPQLLIVDELGYLPMPDDAASAFFQVVARRYEHGSICLTTNRNISSWSEIFEDSVVAVAILDRLLHHATVLAIEGDSYRMRAHRERLAEVRKGVVDTTPG
ncbi:MAG: IS21-like element helper ATPase IstB [Actinomycetota bacterium]